MASIADVVAQLHNIDTSSPELRKVKAQIIALTESVIKKEISVSEFTELANDINSEMLLLEDNQRSVESEQLASTISLAISTIAFVFG